MYDISLPSPGFGTFRLKGDTVKHALTHALNAGFNHVDTAQIYENEQDVGEAISEHTRKRGDIFITTKVWFDNFEKSAFIPSVEESLTKLKTDYVDLLLIHWPSPDGKVPMSEYLPELVSCMHKGLTRGIGVSNFTPELLEQAFSVIGEDTISVNQIEVHPLFQNRDTVNYCQRKGIAVVGYMPVANGKVMENDVLKAIAKEHQTTPASIAIAWQHQLGVVPIPSSTNEEHIQANLDAIKIRLTPEQMSKIEKIDTGKRLIDPDFAPDW
ncbi:2,5-didehydrogluconate reductase DkgB [Alteromonas oceanisediminis]|uniref:2,5-didehydrogluconate reductase DkgB n=1 Tax=Alteromonas oceanisediminis TaxID=2836180 RepID=UPI001BD952B4|nr:2,5-didehydrogluconate reductase DkgB [Alteromonas oceanisediminis]MBT0587003.1 2,5-didehydrogluconate reductase DkgB [Alteromonas oceanisediminis]